MRSDFNFVFESSENLRSSLLWKNVISPIDLDRITIALIIVAAVINFCLALCNSPFLYTLIHLCSTGTLVFLITQRGSSVV